MAVGLLGVGLGVGGAVGRAVALGSTVGFGVPGCVGFGGGVGFVSALLAPGYTEGEARTITSPSTTKGTTRILVGDLISIPSLWASAALAA